MKNIRRKLQKTTEPGTFPENSSKVLRYPRLDTILMVEKFIQTHDGEFRKRKLWESLPKGTMYQTFSLIINYLLYSKKISVDSEGKIGWIHYPGLAVNYHERSDLGRRK
jgi:hypothetical protein